MKYELTLKPTKVKLPIIDGHGLTPIARRLHPRHVSAHVLARPDIRACLVHGGRS